MPHNEFARIAYVVRLNPIDDNARKYVPQGDDTDEKDKRYWFWARVPPQAIEAHLGYRPVRSRDKGASKEPTSERRFPDSDDLYRIEREFCERFEWQLKTRLSSFAAGAKITIVEYGSVTLLACIEWFATQLEPTHVADLIASCAAEILGISFVASSVLVANTPNADMLPVPAAPTAPVPSAPTAPAVWVPAAAVPSALASPASSTAQTHSTDGPPLLKVLHFIFGAFGLVSLVFSGMWLYSLETRWTAYATALQSTFDKQSAHLVSMYARNEALERMHETSVIVAGALVADACGPSAVGVAPQRQPTSAGGAAQQPEQQCVKSLQDRVESIRSLLNPSASTGNSAVQAGQPPP
jgi:hypothetical protein